MRGCRPPTVAGSACRSRRCPPGPTPSGFACCPSTVTSSSPISRSPSGREVPPAEQAGRSVTAPTSPRQAWETDGPNRFDRDVRLPTSKTQPSQPQSTRDDRHRAQAHRCTRDHWREQQAGDRVENARCDRDPERVVDERPPQVLADVPHRRPRKPPCADDAAQITLHQRYVGALHRDVSASPHRDADVRARQCGRVVDAVASHRHHAALGLQTLDDRGLVRRLNVGDHVVESKSSSHGFGGRGVVASQHPHAEGLTPRSSAPAITAAASGCSLLCSRPAAKASTSSSRKPGTATTVTSLGLPSVSVPVLSTTIVSTFSMVSSASAFLISTPAWAPRPVPTMIDMGVARPRAHGQAMMRTATALTTAYAKRGSGPKKPHPSDVTTAMSTTAGTNQDETTSARRWMGARLR